MNLSPEKRKKLSWWIIGIAAACIVIFMAVKNISSVASGVSWLAGLVMPLILGCVIALILNVPMRFFERHLWQKTKKSFLKKLRRPTAYIISLLLIVGVVVGVIWLVIPQFIEAIKVIANEVIDIVSRLSSMNEDELAELPLGSVLLNIEWDELLVKMQNWLKTEGGTILNAAFDTVIGTIGSVVGGIFDFFVAFVFSIYILFNKETLKIQCCRLIRAWLPKHFGEWFIHASAVFNSNLSSFITGQTIEAVILGSLCIIGMLILRIPYAPMIGALVGVTALIPVVGAFIGAGVGAFMILTVSPIKAVMFLVFIIILQQIEGNLIYPKVMGSRVNLPAIWILLAVTVGGSIAGPVGMLAAVPLASTIYILVREATEKREQKLAQRENKVQIKSEKSIESDTQ
ncbi:MAG: AI-2E family transporter [Ruminococcus sp.]|nr:AI-2E family transporter [Ruminococcus sp.]